MASSETLDLEAFAHIVAHDLGAPIRGISIHLKLLASDLDKGDTDNAGQRVDMIQQRLRRLDSMLRRVRHFSRVHVAGQPVNRVDLGPLVAEALEHCDPDIASIDCSGNGQVLGAPLLILTVLQELIGNAIEHHDGEPNVAVEISSGSITVSDDGPGLPANAEDLAALFSLAGKNVREGAGSGLALCRYIARYLGGDLILDSPIKDGRGMRATVRLIPA